MYLGENSVLTFYDLHETAGIPYTEMALLTGTASGAHPSLHCRPREVHVPHAPTSDFVSQYPGQERYARIQAFTDGIAITSLAGNETLARRTERARNVAAWPNLDLSAGPALDGKRHHHRSGCFNVGQVGCRSRGPARRRYQRSDGSLRTHRADPPEWRRCRARESSSIARLTEPAGSRTMRRTRQDDQAPDEQSAPSAGPAGRVCALAPRTHPSCASHMTLLANKSGRAIRQAAAAHWTILSEREYGISCAPLPSVPLLKDRIHGQEDHRSRTLCGLSTPITGPCATPGAGFATRSITFGWLAASGVTRIRFGGSRADARSASSRYILTTCAAKPRSMPRHEGFAVTGKNSDYGVEPAYDSEPSHAH